MKAFKTILFPALVLFAASCAKENIKDVPTVYNGLVPVTFQASSSEATKTTIGDNTDGKYPVIWNETDKISVFTDNSTDAHEFILKSGSGSTSASFTGQVTSGAKEFYSLYPYSQTDACIEGEFGCSLSNEQSSTASNISSGIMVAKADDNNVFHFKNVTSFIKFTIPENSGLTYVAFKGAKSEKISGTISFEFDGVNISNISATENKEVSVGDMENEIAAGVYYLAVAPVSLPEGFIITCYDKESKETDKVGKTDPELVPGMVLNLGTISIPHEELKKGATWSWTATEKVWSANGAKTLGTGSSAQSWTLAGDGGYWAYNATTGLQFGSSNKPYKNLSLTSDFGAEYGVSEIMINANGIGTPSIKVTIGGIELEGPNSIKTSSDDYKFISAKLLSGEIKITMTQSGSSPKAIYVKSITVNPTTKLSDVSDVVVSTAKVISWSPVTTDVDGQVVSDVLYDVTVSGVKTYSDLKETSIDVSADVQDSFKDITITAKSDGYISSSVTVKDVKFGVPTLSVPANVKYYSSSSVVSWDKVTNASGYVYVLDGGEENTIDGTNLNITSEGEHTIKVKAVDDSGKWASSPYSDECSFTVVKSEAVTLWSEDWSNGGTVNPSKYSFSGTKTYMDAALTYSQSATGTKLYNESLAGGTAPELLLSKNNGTWTIKGLPTAGATTMVLSFLSNKSTFAISSTTDGITVSGSGKEWTISNSKSASNFDLTIKNTGTSNARIDNIVLKVK